MAKKQQVSVREVVDKVMRHMFTFDPSYDAFRGWEWIAAENWDAMVDRVTEELEREGFDLR